MACVVKDMLRNNFWSRDKNTRIMSLKLPDNVEHGDHRMRKVVRTVSDVYTSPYAANISNMANPEIVSLARNSFTDAETQVAIAKRRYTGRERGSCK